MSDLIKSLFHSLLACMLLPSAMLMAQEVPSEVATESFTSKIQDLEAKIAALKEFNLLVNQYNPLMKDRRYAEAEVVAKKARDLNPDDPQALIMVEKAKLMRQMEFNTNPPSESISNSNIDRRNFDEPEVPIAEYRRRLFDLEQPVLQLAEKVRSTETTLGKDHPDSVKQRADLRALVQQTFTARQEIQRAELAEFTRRLLLMQQAIVAREKIADVIVDRRLEELLDPNLSWKQPTAALSRAPTKPSIDPPKPRNIATAFDEKQSVSVTLFDVNDNDQSFLFATSAEQKIAPENFDEKLAELVKNRAAIVAGKHTIETTLNETAIFRGGGSFEVPSTDLNWKVDVEWGTKIEIVPKLVDGESVFDIVWNERVRDFKNGIRDFPAITERQTRAVVKSPLPGGTGYLFGPVTGPQNSHHRFIHFFLHTTSPPLATDDPFVRIRSWRPKSEAEKAIGRLVLVFFQDQARRAIPALLIKHGKDTIAVTTGPAEIVPENVGHAIDREFLEFRDGSLVDEMATSSVDFPAPDLRFHLAKEHRTTFQLDKPAAVTSGDVLLALMQGQVDFEVTAKAARVIALDQKTTWQLPSHSIDREFTGLLQIDQRLPEGTPLFKDGDLAGITLLGTRFMKDDVPGSFVVPASRIVEVLQQLKTE